MKVHEGIRQSHFSFIKKTLDFPLFPRCLTMKLKKARCDGEETELAAVFHCRCSPCTSQLVRMHGHPRLLGIFLRNENFSNTFNIFAVNV